MQVPTRLRRASVASIALAVVLAAALTAPAGAVTATDPPDWQSTYNRMIAELMSPYCHGLTLADCPTQGATELRNQIKGWLMSGRSEESILDELEMTYGPSILGAPRMRGIGLLAWIVPPIFFVVGAIGVVIFLRRHTPAQEEGAPQT
jgi:cytochrome c-type biogenesis protein CcmH